MERRYRVLALDDSELIHAKLRMLFRSQSVDLTCTAKWTDVAEACASGNPPDLLILDLDMGEVRGEIVGMGLRSTHSEIPIVIFSSEAEKRLSLAARNVGARAAVAKADGEGLVRTVMQILAATC